MMLQLNRVGAVEGAKLDLPVKASRIHSALTVVWRVKKEGEAEMTPGIRD